MIEDPVFNAPVESLQLMLRTIALADGQLPAVIPDGLYGSSTKAAVMEFQRIHGFPVTGTVDAELYQAIVQAYNQAAELLSQAEAAVQNFPASLVIHPGQYHPIARLAQAMLLDLGVEFGDNFKPCPTSGILCPATMADIKNLQELSGLSCTGFLNKITWNRLCRLYRAIFDRNVQPSQG